MINDNGINDRAAVAWERRHNDPMMMQYMIPFSEWTKDANRVLTTARSYVRSIANLKTCDEGAPDAIRKAVELANELLAVLDAAPYGAGR